MSPDMGKFSGRYLIAHSSRLQVSAHSYLIAAAVSAFVAIGASGASAQSVDDSIVGFPVTPFVAAPVEPGPTTAAGTVEPYPEGGPEPVGPIPAP